MTRPEEQRSSTAHVARDHVFDERVGGVRRYAHLVIGDFSFWKLVRYELISMFVIPVPGALGLAMRRLFCPYLFNRVGRDPVFGRNVVLRNAHRITLGDGVFVDDGSLLDGRGAGEGGIHIGNNVIIHRFAVVTSKGGSIRIGDGVDIGSGASIVSQSGIEIGASASIAGGCRIGGGLVEPVSEDGPEDKTQRRYSRGAVRIGESATVFQDAMILDGVEIGDGSIVGAGALVREDVPAHTTFAPRHQATMIPHAPAPVSRDGRNMEGDDHSEPGGGAEGPETNGAIAAITEALLAAVVELNETRAVEKRLPVSTDTVLLGGELDSLDLVNFIASAESRLERLGIHVNLANTTDEKPNPLRTVGSLGQFVARSGAHDA